MAQHIDITTQRFGRLTALEMVGRNSHRIALWRCTCDCGNEKVVMLLSLRSGGTRSCGCYNNEVRAATHTGNLYKKTHGMTNHPLYQTWAAMKTRCGNPNAPKYYLYGGRGIHVCKEWMHSFPQFLRDMGERPLGHTLNRKDNNGNYSKDNCEWSTISDQNRNRRKYKRSTGLFNEIT